MFAVDVDDAPPVLLHGARSLISVPEKLGRQGDIRISVLDTFQRCEGTHAVVLRWTSSKVSAAERSLPVREGDTCPAVVEKN